jgi:hypothetical protein
MNTKKSAYEITEQEIDDGKVFNCNGDKVTGLNKETWWYTTGKDWTQRSWSGHKYTEFEVKE